MMIFKLLSSLANNSGIPKIIIDDAIIYYNKIMNARTFRGINRDGILASSIYISCSINNYPGNCKRNCFNISFRYNKCNKRM